ncbi:hypothetical protein [Catellatospora citrea]|uniref:Uncharacterized protein n=1 Tax=Catellatospora citrea TaxID=53366 RepID=A0A8J3K742_9ACTN|nr:hypothetical protein [Catellatospora citrea]GIF97896.1 hypothetical protein Cci01nite_29900 [Catellatospora citrea]
MPEPENTAAPEDTRAGRVPPAVKWTVVGGIIAAVIAAVGPPLAERLRPDPKPTSVASAPSTAAPSASPSPSPVAFTLTSPTSAPQCADIAGRGTKPAGREVGLFIKHADDTKYFWEKILTFEGDSWRVDKVMIGAPGDAGKDFDLVLVPMSVQAVVEFSKHDGTAYAVDNPPLPPIATLRVTRTTDRTPC